MLLAYMSLVRCSLELPRHICRLVDNSLYRLLRTEVQHALIFSSGFWLELCYFLVCHEIRHFYLSSMVHIPLGTLFCNIWWSWQFFAFHLWYPKRMVTFTISTVFVALFFLENLYHCECSLRSIQFSSISLFFVTYPFLYFIFYIIHVFILSPVFPKPNNKNLLFIGPYSFKYVCIGLWRK